MEIHEAADLIEKIARSISENPSQFHFEINITGTQATAIGGGTGLSVQATGGGPGSTTIGYQSSMGRVNIEMAQKAANAAIAQQMSTLVDALSSLVSELRSVTPDKNKVRTILDSLKQDWIPRVITSVVSSVIAATILSSR